MKNYPESAVVCFQSGYNCAQSVLSTYAPALGLDREMALKVATGFGGGMGRLGATCGAVTGAFMVIGLKYGQTRGDDLAAKEKTYALIQEFAAQFVARHGTTQCRQLIDCDLLTPEGRQQFSDWQIANKVCHQLVRDAAQILDQLLARG